MRGAAGECTPRVNGAVWSGREARGSEVRHASAWRETSAAQECHNVEALCLWGERAGARQRL